MVITNTREDAILMVNLWRRINLLEEVANMTVAELSANEVKKKPKSTNLSIFLF